MRSGRRCNDQMVAFHIGGVEGRSWFGSGSQELGEFKHDIGPTELKNFAWRML